MPPKNTVESNAETSTPKPTLPRLTYTAAETAELLHTCRDTVYRLIARGKLRSVSCLRTKVIPADEIARFLAN